MTSGGKAKGVAVGVRVAGRGVISSSGTSTGSGVEVGVSVAIQTLGGSEVGVPVSEASAVAIAFIHCAVTELPGVGVLVMIMGVTQLGGTGVAVGAPLAIMATTVRMFSGVGVRVMAITT
jgi:hypothetical protein